jgi:hypothetical protein
MKKYAHPQITEASALHKRYSNLFFPTHYCKNNSIRPRAKAVIVRLALWGVLPVKMAEWLIRRWGLRHV